MNILLTGGTGFLGSVLINAIQLRPDVNLTVAIRRCINIPRAKILEIQDLNARTDWSAALINQQVVIHTAARAHIMKDEVKDPLAEYRRVNVEGTLNLARQAAEAGVKRFIFISSIKVNGEQTSLGGSFTADDDPAPEDAYGISKFEAEQGLQKLAEGTCMEVVIIRPPLVYGVGVKGNFATMTKLVSKGIPLPLGAVENKRSFVSVHNLVDLITTCIEHPAAANQVFLAGDGQDLSSTELLRGIAKAMEMPPRLIPVPASLLMLGAKLLGKKAIAQRLLGSLQVDISKTREVLGWEPPVSVEEGLKRCFPDSKCS
jgi:nucleoside-diphosphate-sugar epimerase